MPVEPPLPPRILIVEDDDAARTMLASWMLMEGFQSETASDLQAARRLLAEREFDLLLADVCLPDGDGPDLVAALEGNNQGLPVIFLTGNPSLETAMRSVSLRVAGYLVKPPNLEELRALIRREVAALRYRRLLTSSRRQLCEWDAELAGLEETVATACAPPLVNYLQVTLRHGATLLGEMQRAAFALGADEAGRNALAQFDLVTSLQRTVQVLEKTRINFKSKELGDLRKQLEALLRQLPAGLGERNSFKRPPDRPMVSSLGSRFACG